MSFIAKMFKRKNKEYRCTKTGRRIRVCRDNDLFANAKTSNSETLKKEADECINRILRKRNGSSGVDKEVHVLEFNPSKDQWKKINEWQDNHIAKMHKSKSIPQYSMKMVPNAVEFEYRFGYTHLGIMGCVDCEVCKKIAMKKSLGQESVYHQLMESMDATYFIGEV